MAELTEATWEIIQKIFPTQQQEQAKEILINECGDNLPLVESWDEPAIERIRFAVLKSSQGDLSKLQVAVKLAQSDWRDSLLEAGFGYSIEAHQKWAEQIIGHELKPKSFYSLLEEGSVGLAVAFFLSVILIWFIL